MMPVEVKISNLNASYGIIPFAETYRINITLETGTRVNFTCMVGDTECSNWTIDWEDKGGW